MTQQPEKAMNELKQIFEMILANPGNEIAVQIRQYEPGRATVRLEVTKVIEGDPKKFGRYIDVTKDLLGNDVSMGHVLRIEG
jgi:hypothetical protein